MEIAVTVMEIAVTVIGISRPARDFSDTNDFVGRDKPPGSRFSGALHNIPPYGIELVPDFALCLNVLKLIFILCTGKLFVLA